MLSPFALAPFNYLLARPFTPVAQHLRQSSHSPLLAGNLLSPCLARIIGRSLPWLQATPGSNPLPRHSTADPCRDWRCSWLLHFLSRQCWFRLRSLMAPRVALLPDDPTTSIMMVTLAAIFFDTLCLPGQLCFFPLEPRHVCPLERCTGYFSLLDFFRLHCLAFSLFPWAPPD